MATFIVHCPRCGRKLYSNEPKDRLCYLCKKEVARESFEKNARTCPICGKRFLPKTSSQIYCSLKCKFKAQQRRVSVTCDYCGKEFFVTPTIAKATKHHFCSPSCKRKWKEERRKDVKRFHLSKELREKVFDRWHGKCAICGKQGTYLDPLLIHHINGNPRDNREVNLILLCKSCHSIVHTHDLVSRRRLNKYLGGIL